MKTTYEALSHIYKRFTLLKPVLSKEAGVVNKITPDILGFKVIVKNDAGLFDEYNNMQVLNVILDEPIKSDHLIGYILKGRKS